jgi:hypothetical protein
MAAFARRLGGSRRLEASAMSMLPGRKPACYWLDDSFVTTEELDGSRHSGLIGPEQLIMLVRIVALS